MTDTVISPIESKMTVAIYRSLVGVREQRICVEHEVRVGSRSSGTYSYITAKVCVTCVLNLYQGKRSNHPDKLDLSWFTFFNSY